jgi:hypothetical protein
MFVPDNIHDGGPQKVGARPGYILKFYDSSIPESQYYKYEDILGFERGSGKFFIYLKGAKDVNAKDKIEITVTGSTISIADSIELIINAPLYETVHQNTTAIIQIVSDTVGESIRYEFSQARITYGTCCSGGGGGRDITVKDEGVTKTTALTSLDFVGSGVTATNSGADVTVTIPGGSTYQAGDGISIDTSTSPDTISVVDRRIQIVNHSIFEETKWGVANQYVLPVLDQRNIDYGAYITNSLTVIASTAFGSFPASGFTRANRPYNRVTISSMTLSSMTSAQIAALGTGAQVKVMLIKYTPTNGDTSITFTREILGNLNFNAVANRIQVSDFSATLSSALAFGDWWGIGYEYTVTSGTKSGDITGLRIQCTAQAWSA